MKDPGGGNKKIRIHHQKRTITKRFDRIHYIADAGRKNGIMVNSKKRHISPQRSSQSYELFFRKLPVKNSIQTTQHRPCIAAAATESCSHRDIFLQTYLHSISCALFTRLQKSDSCPHCKISRISWNGRIVGKKFHPVTRMQRELNLVIQVDLLHPGFQVMISVCTPAQDSQQQVYFCRCLHRYALITQGHFLDFTDNSAIFLPLLQNGF
nr:hypothetical protein [Desulfopila sp. IMCC35006]